LRRYIGDNRWALEAEFALAEMYLHLYGAPGLERNAREGRNLLIRRGGMTKCVKLLRAKARAKSMDQSQAQIKPF